MDPTWVNLLCYAATGDELDASVSTNVWRCHTEAWTFANKALDAGSPVMLFPRVSEKGFFVGVIELCGPFVKNEEGEGGEAPIQWRVLGRANPARARDNYLHMNPGLSAQDIGTLALPGTPCWLQQLRKRPGDFVPLEPADAAALRDHLEPVNILGKCLPVYDPQDPTVVKRNAQSLPSEQVLPAPSTMIPTHLNDGAPGKVKRIPPLDRSVPYGAHYWGLGDQGRRGRHHHGKNGDLYLDDNRSQYEYWRGRNGGGGTDFQRGMDFGHHRHPHHPSHHHQQEQRQRQPSLDLVLSESDDFGSHTRNIVKVHLEDRCKPPPQSPPPPPRPAHHLPPPPFHGSHHPNHQQQQHHHRRGPPPPHFNNGGSRGPPPRWSGRDNRPRPTYGGGDHRGGGRDNNNQNEPHRHYDHHGGPPNHHGGHNEGGHRRAPPPRR